MSKRRLTTLEPFLFAAAASTFYAACSLLIHRSFHSNGWDLGIFDQVTWNTARGQWFEYSFRNISYAGDHWQPLILAIVPVYWVVSRVEALLVIQALALGFAVVPLWAFVRHLHGRQMARAITIAYLAGLGVARLVSFDFHVEAFMPLLAFAAAWAMATRRPAIACLACVLLLTTKEDAALLVLALCWLWAVEFEGRRAPLSLAVIALTYAAIVMLWLMPNYRGDDLNPLRERYGYLGDSVPGILGGILAHPGRVLEHLADREKLKALLLLLAGGGAFFAIARPLALLPAVGLVLLPMLSDHPGQQVLGLQYLVVPAVYVLLVGVVAWARGPSLRSVSGGTPWRSTLSPLAARGIPLIAIALYIWQAPLPGSSAADMDRFLPDSRARSAASVVSKVPGDAIVSAQSAFVPHLSQREKIYQFPRVLDATVVVVERFGPVPQDDIDAGYFACRAALQRLGFELRTESRGVQYWEKVRPAESVPEVPAYCSGQKP